MENHLEKEINAFMKQLFTMLGRHEGEWTVFKDEKPLGFYHSIPDAVKAAYKKYGDMPFLLRQVSREYLVYGKYGAPIRLGMPVTENESGDLELLI